MVGVGLAVAVAALGGTLLLSRKRSSAGPVLLTRDAAELDKILIAAGLSQDWRRFCLVTAAGESRFKSNVYLGLPENQPPGTELSGAWESIGKSEYRATQTAYNRHADYFGKCPWPKGRYTTAGGLFGFLAPNAVYGYRGTELACIDPWSIYDALEAVPMFLAMCRRIYNNPVWKRAPGDWLDLRCGIGALERIGVDSKRREMADKLRKQQILSQLGIPESWLYEKVTRLPDFDIVEVRNRLLAELRPGAPSGLSTASPLVSAPAIPSGDEFATGGASLTDDIPVIVLLADGGSHGSPATRDEAVGAMRSLPLRARVVAPVLPAIDSDEALDLGVDTVGAILLSVSSRFGRLPAIVGIGTGASVGYGLASEYGHLVSALIAVGGSLPSSMQPSGSLYVPRIVAMNVEGEPRADLEATEATLLAFEAAGADLDFHVDADVRPRLLQTIVDWISVDAMVESPP